MYLILCIIFVIPRQNDKQRNRGKYNTWQALCSQRYATFCAIFSLYEQTRAKYPERILDALFPFHRRALHLVQSVFTSGCDSSPKISSSLYNVVMVKIYRSIENQRENYHRKVCQYCRNWWIIVIFTSQLCCCNKINEASSITRDPLIKAYFSSRQYN